MQWIKNTENEIHNVMVKTVACLGYFDGIHKGHEAIIRCAVLEAKERGLKSLVYTFDSSPKLYFGSDISGREITPLSIKTRRMENLSVDILYIDHFGEAFTRQSPEDFFNDVICNRLNAKCVVAGYDYRFGKDREGDITLLKTLCDEKNIPLIEIDPVYDGSRLAASRQIREFIEEGNVEEAALMLGRPYAIEEEVIYGLQIGRTLDIPTINQEFPKDSVIPKFGAYLTRTTVEGDVYYSITNVGKRPTVGDFKDVKVETHIFDFSGDLYGRAILVEFLEFLRGEVKFSSLDELKKTLNGDIIEAKNRSMKYKGD